MDPPLLERRTLRPVLEHNRPDQPLPVTQTDIRIDPAHRLHDDRKFGLPVHPACRQLTDRLVFPAIQRPDHLPVEQHDGKIMNAFENDAAGGVRGRVVE